MPETFTMSNRIVVILNADMDISYGENISKVYLNSYLTKEFVVRPTFVLGPAQSLWVTFANNETLSAATLKTEPTLLAYRPTQTDEGTREVTNDAASVTQIEQIPETGAEYFLQIPQAVLDVASTWYFSLEVREIPDTNNPQAYTAISTSDVGSFIVNNSLARSDGSAPTNLDILSLYNTVLFNRNVPLVYKAGIGSSVAPIVGQSTGVLDTKNFNRIPFTTDRFFALVTDTTNNVLYCTIAKVMSINETSHTVTAQYEFVSPSYEFIQTLLAEKANLVGDNNFRGSQFVAGVLGLEPFFRNDKIQPAQINFHIADSDTILTAEYPDGLAEIKLPPKSGTLALESDIPTVDSEVSETSTNPVENKAIPPYVEERILHDLEPIQDQIDMIDGKIPPQASRTNQLVDKNSMEDFVNSSVNAMAAFYISYNAQGAAFPTKAALLNATTFYSGDKVRVPTQNDYATVLSDESQPKGPNDTYPTTRYTYQTDTQNGTYPNGQWALSFVVNATSLTQAQLDALNSGVTAEDVMQIENIQTELTGKADKSAVDDALSKKASLSGGNIFTGTQRVATDNNQIRIDREGVSVTRPEGDSQFRANVNSKNVLVSKTNSTTGEESQTGLTDGKLYYVQIHSDGTGETYLYELPLKSGIIALLDDIPQGGVEVSNPNLLINGDLEINQRGQTIYTTGFCVDRWILSSTRNSVKYTVATKTLLTQDNYGDTFAFRQYIEDAKSLLNKTVTVSAKINDVVYMATGTVPNSLTEDSTIAQIEIPITFSDKGLLEIFVDGSKQLLGVRISATVSGNTPVTLGYVKLERGATATQFEPRFQEVELALCQRYFVKLNMSTATYVINSLGISLFLNWPVTMRTKPTISAMSMPSFYIEGASKSYTINLKEVTSVSANGVTLYLQGSGITSGKIHILRGGEVTLDAEIY